MILVNCTYENKSNIDNTGENLCSSCYLKVITEIKIACNLYSISYMYYKPFIVQLSLNFSFLQYQRKITGLCSISIECSQYSTDFA